MTRRLAVAFVALLALAPLAAKAEKPGRHPAYMHAISDLRAARWHLAHRPGDADAMSHEREAIDEVDQAIAEIKKAAAQVGKHHPVEEARGPGKAKLHDALDLLERAHKDVKEKEDDFVAAGMQENALSHIRAAIERTKEAIDSIDHPRR
jgi:hypothetical protein